MVVDACFTSDWITERIKSGFPAHRHILEKSIRALALLGHLAEADMDFVFKGGTSLLLHLDPIRRLSTDIDIVCGLPPKELDERLRAIAGLLPFTEYSEDDRGERGLPKRRHFRFQYPMLEKGDQMPVILLDVVEEAACELPRTELPIKTGFIETDSTVMVTLPTVEGLLGDKLSAFAPHTTGVPFENRKGVSQVLQVAKQMFDVGELLNASTDTAALFKAYDATYEKESEYRGNAHSKEEALGDT